MKREHRRVRSRLRRAQRRKILDRLNSMDTGAHHHDREQEDRTAGGIDIARERERRPIIGT
jgi:hypothetical protein